MQKVRFFVALSALALACAPGLGRPVNIDEVEPNEHQLMTQPVALGNGDTLTGNSQGNADFFTITTAGAAPGIYRHVLSTPATNSFLIGAWGQIDGFVSPLTQQQINAIGTGQGQTSTTLIPGTPTVVWYGFGKQERVVVRVGGTASTLADYVLTHTESAETPVDTGTFVGGVMSIGATATGTNNQPDLWVYDANFDLIPGYGNHRGPAALTTKLTRDFGAGTYYVAVGVAGSSSGGIATNRTNPRDDGILTDQVLPYGDVVLESFSSTTAGQVLTLTITDGNAVAHPQATVTKAFSGQVFWFKFVADTSTVTTGACCKADGSCTTTSTAGCAINPLTGGAEVGTTFQASTTCGAAGCLQPATGRCCKTDGTCAVVSSFACAAQYGAWAGAATSCAAACPATLTTAPTMNGWGASALGNAGCVFFDITATNTVAITALDLSLSAALGTAQTVQVWMRQGSYVGVDNDQSQWTQVSPTPGPFFNITSAGGVPLTRLELPAPIQVNAGQTVAFCIGSVTPAAGGTNNTFLRYIDSNQVNSTVINPPIPLNYNDANIALSADRTRTALFGGTSNAPRGFAGRVYYTLPAATVVCCKGTTCTTGFTAAQCTTPDPAGVTGSALGGACDASHATHAGCCYADFDHSGASTIDDLFIYINSWLAGSPYTRISGDGAAAPSIDDLFVFINLWLSGCS